MDIKHKNVFHIIGEKNSGKTTLMKFLISELKKKGYKVGALKHSSHNHELDKPGSDSDEFRKAGSDSTIFSTPNGLSIMINENNIPDKLIEYVYQDCDVVLIESFKLAPGKKVVISDDEKYISQINNVVAIVSNNIIQNEIQVFCKDGYSLLKFITDNIN